MTTDGLIADKYLSALAEILSSLRLKDVLDTTVIQYAQLAQSNKVAVFLVDNQNKAFRLMAARGFGELSLQNMKIIPFREEGIFGEILKSHQPIVLQSNDAGLGLAKSVVQKDQVSYQAAFPLVVGDLIIGAILLEENKPFLLDEKENWHLTNAITASAIANAIIFGRSEYERERLNTLYRILATFQNSALNLNQVLQKTADAALVLGNTPYCALLLCDQESPYFVLAAFKGFDGSSLSEFDLSNSDSLAAQSLIEGTVKFMGKSELENASMPKAMGGGVFRSALALPFIYSGNKVGVLEVFSTDEEAFSVEQIELLEALSGQAVKAIQLAQEHELILAQALTDPHTGLLSRAHFQPALRAEVERSNRHGHQFALLFIDIDYLSRINDRWGQEVGDEIIIQAARIIKGSLREIDLVYRFGGDQFAIILPETPRKDVAIVLERLREKISKLVIPNAEAITFSGGLAAYPEQSTQTEELISVAELALYLAKYQGRNRVVEVPGATQRAESNTWLELANYAKQAVCAERRERAKSHLSNSADYANWLLKGKDGRSLKAVNKGQVPLP